MHESWGRRPFLGSIYPTKPLLRRCCTVAGLSCIELSGRHDVEVAPGRLRGGIGRKPGEHIYILFCILFCPLLSPLLWPCVTWPESAVGGVTRIAPVPKPHIIRSHSMWESLGDAAKLFAWWHHGLVRKPQRARRGIVPKHATSKHCFRERRKGCPAAFDKACTAQVSLAAFRGLASQRQGVRFASHTVLGTRCAIRISLAARPLDGHVATRTKNNAARMSCWFPQMQTFSHAPTVLFPVTLARRLRTSVMNVTFCWHSVQRCRVCGLVPGCHPFHPPQPCGMPLEATAGSRRWDWSYLGPWSHRSWACSMTRKLVVFSDKVVATCGRVCRRFQHVSLSVDRATRPLQPRSVSQVVDVSFGCACAE